MPNDLLFRLTLHGGVVPGAVSFAALAILWWLHRRQTRRDGPEASEPRPGPRWAAPLLIALGVIVADWVVKQSIDLWPRDATRRVPHAALLLGVAGALAGLPRVPVWAAWPLRAAAFAGVAWMLAAPYSPGVLSGAGLWTLIAASGVAGALLAAGAEHGLSRTRGWTGPAAALAVVGALQPFLHFAGYSSGSLALAGAIAALSAALLVSIRLPALSLGAGTGTMIVGLVLVGLIGAGVQSEPKSLPALALTALSPAALALSAGAPLRTLTLRAAAVALTIGPALGLLFIPKPADAQDNAEIDWADYYSN